ncbi:hypothetical protein AD006_29650 (plasmid) [Pseudonocardia sp. EC080610-09]|uniref:hypothetical protein n=1 Tax=unclassified Pseudonocardia TaxID=2619320 RepID=UPI00070607D8|nr:MULTISPECIES: hypothetical protein [unclassified Pseudonocardia]ALL79431.1 hypothetical protein AD006_29650 [Pseudonocardia sp. EC080610-09]ALL85616.1 hypothetical protein AD017_31600 [Pseudonocardia sp. EC080619-01]
MEPSKPVADEDEREVAVAVASDGSRHSHQASRRSLSDALARDAEIVGGVGGFAAEPLVITATDDVVDAIEQLPRRFRAVFLTRTDARPTLITEVTTRHHMPLVLTEQAATTTVLCASALAQLHRVKRAPMQSRVVIAGGHHLPELGPLLMLAGFYDQTYWSDRDRETVSLEQASDGADIVIDVRRGSAPAVQTALIAQNFPAGAVIRPTGLDARALVAPGILRVALESPPASIHVGLPMLRRCAEALAQVIPPTMPWPGLSKSDAAGGAAGAVTDLVSEAVRRGIDPRLASS